MSTAAVGCAPFVASEQQAEATKSVVSAEDASTSDTQATLIEATPLTAEANTSSWMWLSIVGTLIMALMIRRAVALSALVQIARAEASNEQVNCAPTLLSVVQSYGKSASPIGPVQNLCAEILSQKSTKLIAFSSMRTGEGKTFIATRLAMALAALDKKVLVLDLAMNSQAVAKAFDVQTDTTLADVIDGKSDILQSVHQTSIPGLDVIAAGEIRHGAMGLLSWKDNENTVLQLKNYYDFILVDTDDFSQNPGALAIMKWCDLSLVIDAAQGADQIKSVDISKIIDKKNLINTFVVYNSIKEQKETKKPSKKTNRIIEVKTENPDSTHTIDEQDNRVDEQTKKPSFLKRVALWFF
ncbi:MAG: AAA family ATPase [Bacteroidota bacterium]